MLPLTKLTSKVVFFGDANLKFVFIRALKIPK